MSIGIFIDRDGVIIEDQGYVHRIRDFKLLKNAAAGLKLLKNFKLFVITNQSGIGRGYYKLEDFLKFNTHLIDTLKKHGIKIERTYYCPHKPNDNCECRKPKIKLLRDAEKDFGVDLKKSYVVGDMKSDLEMGSNAGCMTILVLTGHGMAAKNEAKADYIAKDLLGAAKLIRENDK